jgi:hypothetical protein
MLDTPPSNSRQARELARLNDRELIRETWQEVREQHGEAITSRALTATTAAAARSVIGMSWGAVPRPTWKGSWVQCHLPSKQR